ncbi:MULTISPECIES: pitrilysin family protein [unclassified Spirosoma]|uniref:M16 family metallopeptidase n=1 Tax=unclassified Spirosoma TaxID=2621999 RepID=UPI00095B17C0|nr:MULTISPECIES: insulinase family protein [unclassified Spirosoma]MBN8824048.1 insulinase family protein [Spirosoma sp.]OJW70449.1 MAG: peptidase M16 [Spirosoma sp. 48-14]
MVRFPILLNLLCGASLVVAQPAPKPKTVTKPTEYQAGSLNLNSPIPVDPAVKVGKLPNGLTYYIRKNAEPKNRAELRLVIRVGSVLENDNQQGLAHFMEHMEFNGTKNFPKNELVNYLQSAGVRFGADLNAYTGFDETVYQLPVPTDSANVFNKAFQILEDWAHNATIDPAEVNKERGVVLEERRLGRGAGQRMRDKYFPALLNNSQYSKRLPIGTEQVLTTFKTETLRQFYHDWYRPDLMAVVAVGDFDVKQVEGIIREKFGRIPAVKNPKPRTEYDIPSHKDTKVVIVTDPEQPNTVIQVIYKRPEIKEKTLNDLRESIKRGLFNTMLGNRIQELTQQANPPFLGGYSNYGDFLGNLDAFTSIAVAKGGNVEQAIRAVLNENARVKQFGFTATELERAKQEFMTSVEQAYSERNKTRSSSFVNDYVQNFTEKEPYTSIEFYYDFLKKEQPGIKLAEVNALVDQFIHNDNRAVIVMAPEKEKDKLPTQAQILSYIDDAGKGLTAYEDKTVDSPLLATQPTASPVVNEKKISDIGVTEWTLKNGVKVVLKPTDFKNDQILFSANSLGGTSLYDLKDFQSARFSSTLTAMGGTGAYNQIQLGKFLAGKQVSVFPYVGELSEGVNGSAAPKDLETALQLLYSYFTQPRKDPDVVKGFLSNQRSALQNQINTPTPQKVFQDTVSVTLGANNPRRQPLTPDDLDKIDLDRALQIYQERFANGDDFRFFFVGNFKEEQIKPLIEKYLGGLPASDKPEKFNDLGIRIPSGQISKTVYKGLDPKASVQLVYSGDLTWSTETTTQLDALAEVLEIKLIEKLREEESGVYGVGASAAYAKYPVPRYTFRINFGCAPENVEKLIAKTQEQINDLKQKGALPADIAKFKAETRRETEIQLKDNQFWLGYLQNQYYNGDAPDEVLHENEQLDKVTVESTKASANKYLGQNFIRLVLMPEKKQ